MSKKNEVTVKEETEVMEFNDAAFQEALPEQDLTANDIQIPKLLIMQGQSPQVLAGDFKFGDLVDMANMKVMANFDKPVDVVPFHWEKYWIIKKEVEGRFVFARMEKMTAANQNLDAFAVWEEEGKKMKRIYAHFFYLLVKGQPIPYTLCFRGASKQAGDALVTQMYVSNKNLNVKEAWKRSPMAKVMQIKLVRKTNKNNTFAVLEATVKEDATYKAACGALKWMKDIKGGEANADLTEGENEAPIHNTGDY